MTAHLDAREAAARPTLLVTMHSFTPVYSGNARPMQAAVLYNRDQRLAQPLLRLLRAEPGLVVGENEPYSVDDHSDYGINVHGEQRGFPSVEIEIRQDLIADAAGQREWVERLARLLPEAAGKKGQGSALDPPGASRPQTPLALRGFPSPPRRNQQL
ncbi:MAG: N-formylglutamate amidohydrolase [Rhodospirillales bacterium]